ncbi:DMT family transporter [Anaerosporobacter sp.]|uniref:DMT family transporter n=1 Tax=Anaerosporobacter sp. TaxID=1872529 RepID=UPI00286ECE38|nr:DMT family transporter [Anaerosporobacter sp.]
MIPLLAILNGILITTMIMMNGELTSAIGNYHATVFIHLSGLILITIFLFLQRKKIKAQQRAKFPLYLYAGGTIGVLTVVFNNLSTVYLGVTITLGISLFAQTTTSLIVDHFGLLGSSKHAFTKHKLIGLTCIILGIFAMFL